MILPDGYSDVPAGKIAAVVTHLEMTARPAPRPDPAGAWTLRRVRCHRSTGFAISIAASARNGCGSRGYGCRTPNWPRSFTRRWWKSTRWHMRAATKACSRLDFREPGQCEIVFFGVTAKLVGTGAGRWLMNRALEIAWSRPIARVWLHTCTFDHPAALAFYQRSGFRPFRRQVEVVDDPRLDGTVPRDVARHVPVIE